MLTPGAPIPHPNLDFDKHGSLTVISMDNPVGYHWCTTSILHEETQTGFRHVATAVVCYFFRWEANRAETPRPKTLLPLTQHASRAGSTSSVSEMQNIFECSHESDIY